MRTYSRIMRRLMKLKFVAPIDANTAYNAVPRTVGRVGLRTLYNQRGVTLRVGLLGTDRISRGFHFGNSSFSKRSGRLI